jgi:hypothetical protein
MQDKDDEDQPLAPAKKRPSVFRDWAEMREILAVAIPASRASSFLKVWFAHPNSSLPGDHELVELFRHHAFLYLLPPPLQSSWDSQTAELVLQQKTRSSVPVHGEWSMFIVIVPIRDLIHSSVLNERTLEVPASVCNGIISQVMDEGRMPNHRPLNVLSIPLTTGTYRTPVEQ